MLRGYEEPPGSAATYTLSLHDALPILVAEARIAARAGLAPAALADRIARLLAIRSARDRKSTRLNSSHRCTSYAVFCLKKKIRWPFHQLDEVELYSPLNELSDSRLDPK